jgi:hypothetical protein
MYVYNMHDFARENFFVLLTKEIHCFCDVTVAKSTIMQQNLFTIYVSGCLDDLVYELPVLLKK